MVRLVLFDIDGTLIRTGGAGVKAFASTFAEVFGLIEATKTLQFAGRTDTSLVRECFRLHGVAPTAENFQRVHRGMGEDEVKAILGKPFDYISSGSLLPDGRYIHKGTDIIWIERGCTILIVFGGNGKAEDGLMGIGNGRQIQLRETLDAESE